MKTHPILFKPEMVQAILSGKKSQTRRVIKTQPSADHQAITLSTALDGTNQLAALYHKSSNPIVKAVNFPFGNKGDFLWVRESWKLTGTNLDGEFCVQFKDGTKMRFDPSLDREDYWMRKCENLVDVMSYKPSFESDDENERFTWDEDEVPWKPSIHMPKDIARIFLKITNITIERLHDISSEDIIAEGINTLLREHEAVVFLRDKWQDLWIQINGQESWDANPYLWVIEFERTLKPNNWCE